MNRLIEQDYAIELLRCYEQGNESSKFAPTIGKTVYLAKLSYIFRLEYVTLSMIW